MPAMSRAEPPAPNAGRPTRCDAAPRQAGAHLGERDRSGAGPLAGVVGAAAARSPLPGPRPGPPRSSPHRGRPRRGRPAPDPVGRAPRKRAPAGAGCRRPRAAQRSSVTAGSRPPLVCPLLHPPDDAKLHFPPTGQAVAFRRAVAVGCAVLPRAVRLGCARPSCGPPPGPAHQRAPPAPAPTGGAGRAARRARRIARPARGGAPCRAVRGRGPAGAALGDPGLQRAVRRGEREGRGREDGGWRAPPPPPPPPPSRPTSPSLLSPSSLDRPQGRHPRGARRPPLSLSRL